MSEFIHPPPGPPVAAINAIDRPKPNKYADKRLKRSIANAKKKQKLQSSSATQTISTDAASQLDQRSVSPRRGDNSPIRSPRHDDGVGATRTLSPRGQFEAPVTSRPIQPVVGVEQGKTPLMIPTAKVKPLSVTEEYNLLKRDYSYLEYVATFFSDKLMVDYMFDMDKIAELCQAITRDWKSGCLSLKNVVKALGCSEWKQLCQQGVEVEIRPIEQHYIRELLVTLSQILSRTLLNSVAQLCALPVTVVSQDAMETEGFVLHDLLSVNSNAYIWEEYLKAMMRYNTDVVIPNNSYSHLLSRGQTRANWSPQFLKEFAEAKMSKLDVRIGSKNTNIATFQLNEPVKFQKMFTSLSDVLAATAAIYATFPEIFVEQALKNQAASSRHVHSPEALSFYISQLISGVVRSLDYITQSVVNVSLDSSPTVVGLPLLLRNIFLIADHDPISTEIVSGPSGNVMRVENRHQWNYTMRIALPRTFAMYTELEENVGQSFSSDMPPEEIESAIFDVIRECEYLKRDPLFKDDQLKLIPKLSLLFPDAKTMDTIQAAINTNNKVIEQLFYGIIPFTALDRATQLFTTSPLREEAETDLHCLTPDVEARLTTLLSDALEIPMPIDGFAGTATERQVHYDGAFSDNDTLLPPMGAAYLLQRQFNLRPIHAQMEVELVARRAVSMDELSKLKGAKRESLLMQSWLAWASREAHSNQLYQDERLDSPLSIMAHDIKSRPRYAAFFRNLLYDIRAIRADSDAQFSPKTRTLLAEIAEYIKAHEAYPLLLDYIELAEEDERTATADLNGGEGVARLLRLYKMPLIRLPPSSSSSSLFAMPASDYIDQINQSLLGTANIAYRTIAKQAKSSTDSSADTKKLVTIFKNSIAELLLETARDLLGIADQRQTIRPRDSIRSKDRFDNNIILYPPLITEVKDQPDAIITEKLSRLVELYIMPFLNTAPPKKADLNMLNSLRELVMACKLGTMPLFLSMFDEKSKRDRRLYLWIVTDIIRMIISYQVLTLVNLDRLTAIAKRKDKTTTMAEVLGEYLDNLELEKGMEDDPTVSDGQNPKNYRQDSKMIKYLLVLQRTAAEVSDKRKFEWASGSSIANFSRMSHMAATMEGKRRIRAIVSMVLGKGLASGLTAIHNMAKSKPKAEITEVKKKLNDFKGLRETQIAKLEDAKASFNQFGSVNSPDLVVYNQASAPLSWKAVEQDPAGNFFLFIQTTLEDPQSDINNRYIFPSYNATFARATNDLISMASQLKSDEIRILMNNYTQSFNTLKWMQTVAVGDYLDFYESAVDISKAILNITKTELRSDVATYGEYLGDLNSAIQSIAGELINAIADRTVDAAKTLLFTPEFDTMVKKYVPAVIEALHSDKSSAIDEVVDSLTKMEEALVASPLLPPINSVMTSASASWFPSLEEFIKAKWEIAKVIGGHGVIQYGGPHLLELIAATVRTYVGEKDSWTEWGVNNLAYALMVVYLLCPEEKMPSILTSSNYGVKLDAEWEVPKEFMAITDSDLDALYKNNTLNGMIRYQLLDVCLPNLTRTNIFTAVWNVMISGGWGLALGALVHTASTILRCTALELGSQAVTAGGMYAFAGTIGTFCTTLALDVLTPFAARYVDNYCQTALTRREKRLAKKVSFKVDVNANKFDVLKDDYKVQFSSNEPPPLDSDETAQRTSTAARLFNFGKSTAASAISVIRSRIAKGGRGDDSSDVAEPVVDSDVQKGEESEESEESGEEENIGADAEIDTEPVYRVVLGDPNVDDTSHSHTIVLKPIAEAASTSAKYKSPDSEVSILPAIPTPTQTLAPSVNMSSSPTQMLSGEIKEAYDTFMGDKDIRTAIYANMVTTKKYIEGLSDANSPHYRFLTMLTGAANQVDYKPWILQLFFSDILDEHSNSDFIFSKDLVPDTIKSYIKSFVLQALQLNKPLNEEVYQLATKKIVSDLIVDYRSILIKEERT